MEFDGDGTIEDRRKRYEDRSNPFDKFWEQFIDDTNADAFIPVWEFEKEVNDFMKENHARHLSDRTIGKILKDKGIEQGRTRIEWNDNEMGSVKQIRIWRGIKWK